MAKPDDCTITPHQHRLIRQHARLALEAADGIGVFPTPISAVMDEAKVLVADHDLAEKGLLRRLQRSARDAVKSALGKILGVLDVAARVVYLDRKVHVAKLPFLKLHETGHAVLPWQRDIYLVTEESERELAPEIADAFEREANAFASEVLFQLDAFTEQAAQSAFNIRVPLKLSKRFGASVYASVRRYVSTNHRACLVLVLEPLEVHPTRGFTCQLRRVVASPSFMARFGELDWPDSFSPDDEIGAAVPVGGKRMSGRRQITLVDRNGEPHECLAEAFDSTKQVFVLIHAIASLTRATVAVCNIPGTI